MTGPLFVLEGLDGSGKATQTELLCRALGQHGTTYQKVSFPDYSQPSSALVQMYLNGRFGMHPGDVNAYAAASFYAVDRFASYRQFWKEALERGAAIVADRYTTSNLIYQLTKLPQDEWEAFVEWVEDYEYGKLELPRPSLTFFLDMPPDISQQLLDQRYAGDRQKKDLHERDVEFLKACRESAYYCAERLSWTVVACARDGKPRDIPEIAAEIWKTVLRFLDVCQ